MTALNSSKATVKTFITLTKNFVFIKET